MKLTKITEDIFQYENFISDDECKKVINLFKRNEEMDPEYWRAISFYESYSAMYPPDGDPILKEFGLSPTWFSDLEQRFKEVAAEIANKPVESMSKISFHNQRWLPGAFATLHSDNSSSDGTLGAFTRSRYAIFLYLNGDFEGGLLKFEAQNGQKQVTMKPEPGLLGGFHGGHKNMHEVTMVKKGTRYTIGSFWDDREESDYPQEIRDDWARELTEVRALQKNEQEEWDEVKEKGLILTKDGTLINKEEVL